VTEHRAFCHLAIDAEEVEFSQRTTGILRPFTYMNYGGDTFGFLTKDLLRGSNWMRPGTMSQIGMWLESLTFWSTQPDLQL
jgi:hypothetical protein